MSSISPVTEPASPAAARRRAALPALRRTVQGACAAFLLAKGLEFRAYHHQALAGRALLAHRPPTVEAFLPLSALLGLERFALTGAWDDLHPAGPAS